MTAPGRRPRGSPVPWLIMVAAALVAALSLGYTLALRSELTAAQQASRSAAAQVELLQAELADVQAAGSRSERVVDVVTAPDVRQVRLRGSEASGMAYLSASRGLAVHATGLPALEANRGFQLWAILPGGQPVSLGMLAVTGATALQTAALPAGMTRSSISVTIEDAAGSPSGQPTTAPVLVGSEN